MFLEYTKVEWNVMVDITTIIICWNVSWAFWKHNNILTNRFRPWCLVNLVLCSKCETFGSSSLKRNNWKILFSRKVADKKQWSWIMLAFREAIIFRSSFSTQKYTVPLPIQLVLVLCKQNMHKPREILSRWICYVLLIQNQLGRRAWSTRIQLMCERQTSLATKRLQL